MPQHSSASTRSVLRRWCVVALSVVALATRLSEQVSICHTLLLQNAGTATSAAAARGRIFWLQHFAALVAVDCAKRGVDGLGRVAPAAQVAVEHTTLLECTEHLGLAACSTDVPRVVGSVGQIRVGR